MRARIYPEETTHPGRHRRPFDACICSLCRYSRSRWWHFIVIYFIRLIPFSAQDLCRWWLAGADFRARRGAVLDTDARRDRQTLRCGQRLRHSAASLGGRADIRLAGSLSAPCQRFREPDTKRTFVPQACVDPADDQEAMQLLMYTPTLREPANRACESVPRRFQLFHDPSRLS